MEKGFVELAHTTAGKNEVEHMILRDEHGMGEVELSIEDLVVGNNV